MITQGWKANSPERDDSDHEEHRQSSALQHKPSMKRRLSSSSVSTSEYCELAAQHKEIMKGNPIVSTLLQLGCSFAFWDFDMFRVQGADGKSLEFDGLFCCCSLSK